MTFEIGPLTPALPPAGVSPARARATAGAPGFEAVLSSATAPARSTADTAELSLPGSPPPAVLDAVGAAAGRAETLAAQGRELHFERDADSGRVIVQVRELSSGAVIRTIPPKDALDFLMGGSR